MRAMLLACLVTFVPAIAGCTHTKTTSTARTGVEQMLISNSVDQALDKVDWSTLAGRSVFVDEKYIDCVDKAYIVGSLRHRVAHAGARLAAKAEGSDVTLEIRSGGVGTDTADMFVGIPEITLPGMLTLPEVRLINRMNQTGTAKLGIVAYDTKSMRLLGEGGTSLARSDDSNWFVLGMGPYQNGTVRSEVRRSTSGPAAMHRGEIPTLVSFRDNSASPSPEVQQTSGQESGAAVFGQ